MDFGGTPITEMGKRGGTSDYGKIFSVQSFVFKVLLGSGGRNKIENSGLKSICIR